MKSSLVFKSPDWIKIAAVFGFFAVALGAFGAHGLRQFLTPDLLAIYHTGVLYHFVHTLSLLGFGILSRHSPTPSWPGWCFCGGIFLFSGSLYLLAITGIRVLGAITPIGGLLFLCGWIGIAFFIKSSN
jgi:uncharacterized membrane protein YgdD (TMEM256/DUF423 family)